jgi:hypothetical protein
MRGFSYRNFALALFLPATLELFLILATGADEPLFGGTFIALSPFTVSFFREPHSISYTNFQPFRCLWASVFYTTGLRARRQNTY